MFFLSTLFEKQVSMIKYQWSMKEVSKFNAPDVKKASGLGWRLCPSW